MFTLPGLGKGPRIVDEKHGPAVLEVHDDIPPIRWSHPIERDQSADIIDMDGIPSCRLCKRPMRTGAEAQSQM